MRRLLLDTWKYFDITHREHLICNPTDERKLDELVALLRLSAGDAVVDIASGKGEFLIRLAEAYAIEGTGVDVSPFCIADAQAKLAQRAVDAKIEFLHLGGADYAPETPESLQLASCIGASWIWGGHEGTLAALTKMVAPGGWVVVGEPYWRKDPSEEYLEASGDKREDFGTHARNAEAGEALGLELVYTIVSNEDDWDRYEGLQWYATSEYARTHPDDPDLPVLLERVAQYRTTYLRWGRETLGWAMYVFRRGGDS